MTAADTLSCTFNHLAYIFTVIHCPEKQRQFILGVETATIIFFSIYKGEIPTIHTQKVTTKTKRYFYVTKSSVSRERVKDNRFFSSTNFQRVLRTLFLCNLPGNAKFLASLF